MDYQIVVRMKSFFATEFKIKCVTGGYGDSNGGNDRMVVQEDTVFVSGMNTDITEDEICQHFGAIGLIKVCLLIY